MCVLFLLLLFLFLVNYFVINITIVLTVGFLYFNLFDYRYHTSGISPTIIECAFYFYYYYFYCWFVINISIAFKLLASFIFIFSI